MSRFARLRTLAETNARPRAQSKAQLGSQLDRAIARKVARRADKLQLQAWAFAVKTRDGWKDRKTGVRVHRTRDLDPLRAEAHHIEPRENRATRYDVRNGVTLSFAVHFAIERHELTIVGTRFFTKHGTRYIDATYPVTFRAA